MSTTSLSFKEFIIRFFGFVVPWGAISWVGYLVLANNSAYTHMIFGGAAALVALTVRDTLLDHLLAEGKNSEQ